MPRSLRRPRLTRLLMTATAALALAVAAVPSPAHAGTYTVTGACNLWEPWDTGGSGTAVYPECPSVWARTLGGPFSTAPGGSAGWVFRAPPGTVIDGFRLHGAIYGSRGWQAALYSETTGTMYENCPGVTCPGAAKYLYDVAYPGGGAAIIVRLRCGSTGGCPNNEGLTGYFLMYTSAITLMDPSAPAVAIAGGSLVGGGWNAGTRTLAISGSDNTGISEYRAVIDGAFVSRSLQSCNYGQKIPCPNGQGVLEVPTAGLKDGPHTLTAEAVDSAGNVSSSAARIYTDNTPPRSPWMCEWTGARGGAQPTR